MSKQIEAIKLALEALAIADNIALVGLAYTPKSIDAGVLKMRNAAAALREALAEQPERPYRFLQDNGSKYFGESWDKAEQPAQQCVCGEPETSGTHRTAGPCYAPPPPQQGGPSQYQELREALENLMQWQVKNVKVWHNGAYDQACMVMKRHDATIPQPAQPQEQITHQQAAQLVNEMAAQQEPVGALILGGLIDTSDGPEYEEWDIEWNHNAIEAMQYRLVTCDPVTLNIYTTPPPQRQPLTDMEIDGEWMLVRDLDTNDVEKSRLFARAIEAAHGITKGEA